MWTPESRLRNSTLVGALLIGIAAVFILLIRGALWFQSAADAHPNDTQIMLPQSLLNRFIYYPDPILVATPRALELDFSDVWLTAGDGVRIHGWFVPATNPTCSVLFLHGNAGNISHRLDNVRLLVEQLDCQVLIVDYRGYGRSEGVPSEQGLYLDAAAAWRWLRANSTGPYIIFGRSLGGAVALQLATATGAEPDGVIVENTFTRLRDMAADMVLFSVAQGLMPDLYPSIDRIRDLERAAVDLPKRTG